MEPETKVEEMTEEAVLKEKFAEAEKALMVLLEERGMSLEVFIEYGRYGAVPRARLVMKKEEKKEE